VQLGANTNHNDATSTSNAAPTIILAAIGPAGPGQVPVKVEGEIIQSTDGNPLPIEDLNVTSGLLQEIKLRMRMSGRYPLGSPW
jgi:hypothetical protein